MGLLDTANRMLGKVTKETLLAIDLSKIPNSDERVRLLRAKDYLRAANEDSPYYAREEGLLLDARARISKATQNIAQEHTTTGTAPLSEVSTVINDQRAMKKGYLLPPE